jgi:hypothetical protein
MRLASFLVGLQLVVTAGAADGPPPSWDKVPKVRLAADLKFFWNVGGGDDALNYKEAELHGFGTVELLNTFADYPGDRKEAVRPGRLNPWAKPPFFEKVVRRNIDAELKGKRSIMVHDIEFEFEEDLDKARADEATRKASGVDTKEKFRAAYYKEWASWYTLPCRWAKEKNPKVPVGIYGPQPFRRDFRGRSGKDAEQIDGTHRTDEELWGHIDPAVDFYITSVYCFHDDPGSVYYMASNVEGNWLRTRKYGDKPVYAYVWLRYHSGNEKLGNKELDDYLVEAAAVLPYFCGGRGLVLWGAEPKLKGQYYRTLPLFMRSLARLEPLAGKIAKARGASDEPAHVAWEARRPLLRKLKVSDGECLVLAAYPWQKVDETRKVSVECGGKDFELVIRGRHTEVYHIEKGAARRLDMKEP